MDTNQTLTVVGIAGTVLIAAASWLVAWKRPNEREQILEDIRIRDALLPGEVRSRLEDSIDERTMHLARISEARRPFGGPTLGMTTSLLAFMLLALGAALQNVLSMWVALLLGVVGGATTGWGFTKKLPGSKRLTPRRQVAVATDIAVGPGPSPVTPPAMPVQRESRRSRRRQVPRARQVGADAPRPRA